MKTQEQLMRWRKADLEDLAQDNARKIQTFRSGQALPVDLKGLDKRGLVHLIMGQGKKLSAIEGAQGE